jgi:hypothetical protein
LNVATYRGIVRQRVGKLARLFDALKIDSSAIQADREVKRPLRIGLRNEIIQFSLVGNGAALNLFDNGMEWSLSGIGFRFLCHVIPLS